MPQDNSVALAEFEIITRYFNQPCLSFASQSIALGIGDDCALINLEAGMQLAVSMDLLQEGVHFPTDCDPFLLAQRSLLVNLSDLAAMGAAPAGFTLGLSLPVVDEHWLEQFAAGLAVVAQANACPLIGGDTTRGPLSICIQVHGSLPAGTALRRSGAQPGDLICVSGTLGDAAAALALMQGRVDESLLTEAYKEELLKAFYQPSSRLVAGQALRGLATAAIDISDGLVADLGHIIDASVVGASICVDWLPVSAAFCAATAPAQRVALAVGGGDDYELCFTIAEHKFAEAAAKLAALGVQIKRIGEIRTEIGLHWRNEKGEPVTVDTKGYVHFD